jgi:hypothetical protein
MQCIALIIDRIEKTGESESCRPVYLNGLSLIRLRISGIIIWNESSMLVFSLVTENSLHEALRSHIP